jgi:hypothetical protein
MILRERSASSGAGATCEICHRQRVGSVLDSAGMTAVAWSAIGLLAAPLLGSLYYLGSRIDALGAHLDGRIDTRLGRHPG